MAPDPLLTGVVVGALVLLAGITAVRLARRTGVPSLLAYLALGLAIGEAGLGIRFDDAVLTERLGLLALAVILLEGGLTTRWSRLRPAVPAAAMLSTVGVAVSIAVVGGIAHAVVGLPWRPRCCSAPSSPRPTPPRCSRRCAACRCAGARRRSWRQSRG